MTSSERFVKIREACIEASTARMVESIADYGIERVKTIPRSFCVFRVDSVEQDAVKGLVPYLKRNAEKMGLRKEHRNAEVAQYTFKEDWIIKKILESAELEI